MSYKFLILLCFLLVGCAQGSRLIAAFAQEGEPCATDRDCALGLRCAFGEEGFQECVPDRRVVGGGDDDSEEEEGLCEVDADCLLGQRCEEGSCEDPCASNLDCDQGLYCEEGACRNDPCVEEPGPSCCAWADDGRCDEPFRCALGTDGGDCDDPDPDPDPDPDAGLCPPGAPVLGRAGQTLIESFPVRWDMAAGGASWTSAPISLRLPSDLDGISATVYINGRQTSWAGLAIDRGDLPLIPEWVIASSLALPFNESSDPEGGCLELYPLAEGDRRGQEDEVVVVTRRYRPSSPVYQLHVILVGSPDIYEEELDEALEIARSIYTRGGAPRFEVQMFALNQSSTWRVEELDRLRGARVGDDPLALRLFVVDGFSGESLYGIAGGIPGPTGLPGTESSGVVVGVESHFVQDAQGWYLDVDELGATIGHELGHQLGLFHTTEADGSQHDPIGDTPQCNANGEANPDRCPDGQLMMFWTPGSRPQTQISATQAEVMRRNPAAR